MVTFRVGNNRASGTIEKFMIKDEPWLSLKYSFNEVIKNEMKIMLDTPRWHPETKSWICKDSLRSKFILEHLQGLNPFKQYDLPLPENIRGLRPEVKSHQHPMIAHGLFRKRALIAGEMGVGKTLSAFEIMEQSLAAEWWYIAPRGALISTYGELKRWGCKVRPRLMTYEELLRIAVTWKAGDKAPEGIILDELSKCKNEKTKRTQAAQHVANNMPDGFVIGMTGTPAPKSPVDWWSLCEIVRPGFLKEGSVHKFKERLAVIKQEENLVTGSKYPKIITFRDNPLKCDICGVFEESSCHAKDAHDLMVHNDNHYFKGSKNEVHYLSERTKGLVLGVFKKDCLDLPEKVYQMIQLEPTTYMKKLAKMTVKNARSGAQALIHLRELSDGFQYAEKLVRTDPCGYCTPAGAKQGPGCTHCSNKGSVKVYETETIEIDTPKVQALIDTLELMEEKGRLVTYAGFSGSIDRCLDTTIKAGWDWIRVDGRGWHTSLGVKEPTRMLEIFQSDDERKINFIGHPGSAGMGLTLTYSDTILYYSNDFNGESRIQSEDRIHRIGSRGANIIDLIHLPTDQTVLNNLKAKRDLQKMSLGELDHDYDVIPDAVA